MDCSRGWKIVSGNDYLLGDFSVGNYAWEVEQMRLLNKFTPAKGKLGLWEFTL